MSELQEILGQLKENMFLRPDGRNANILVDLVRQAVDAVVTKQSGPYFNRTAGRQSIEDLIQQARIPEKTTSGREDLFSYLSKSLQGSVRVSNPYMLKNIIPLPSFVHISVNCAVSLLMPNAVTGEDAGDSLNAEISCVSALSKMAGYDAKRSAGLFTFGGTGTNLYAFKIGINKVQPDSFYEGIDKNIVVVGSWPAHYSHKSACTWLGMGQKNHISVISNLDQTTNLDALEEKCRELIQSGKKIATIVGAGGTTSNMAIDDFSRISELRDMLINEFNLDYRIHVHADSVIGWAYLNFVGYDFESNPLGFTNPVLDKLKIVTARIRTLSFADSFGVDFHKTGYMPYVSSMFIVRDKQDLANLGRDPSIMTPLFHEDKTYNPGKFTLETSRSTANILATWIALQVIGKQGYQALLGHSLEMANIVRSRIDRESHLGLLVVNVDSFGSDVFVRCYPKGGSKEDLEIIFKQELDNDETLKCHNRYTSEFFNWLSANKSTGEEGIALSKTSAAFYTHTGKPMHALRIYILNPYTDEHTLEILVDRLVRAKHEYDMQ